jgi:hypothetical protein
MSLKVSSSLSGRASVPASHRPAERGGIPKLPLLGNDSQSCLSCSSARSARRDARPTVCDTDSTPFCRSDFLIPSKTWKNLSSWSKRLNPRMLRRFACQATLCDLEFVTHRSNSSIRRYRGESFAVASNDNFNLAIKIGKAAHQSLDRKSPKPSV